MYIIMINDYPHSKSTSNLKIAEKIKEELEKQNAKEIEEYGEWHKKFIRIYETDNYDGNNEDSFELSDINIRKMADRIF